MDSWETPTPFPEVINGDLDIEFTGLEQQVAADVVGFWNIGIGSHWDVVSAMLLLGIVVAGLLMIIHRIQEE